MAVTQQTMSDEHRKSVALEYLKRLDRGEGFFDLFADDAEVYFPKWGLATGRKQFEKLFADLGSLLSSIRHDYAYFNYIIQGDFVVVEGTSLREDEGRHGVASRSHPRWAMVRRVRDPRFQDPTGLHLPGSGLRGG